MIGTIFSLINFGLIGTILLISAMILFVTKYAKYFPLLNLISTVCLFIHALSIKDVYFSTVNGIIGILLIIKVFQKDENNNSSTSI